MWFSIKRHIIVFACFLLAMRFIACPVWTADQATMPSAATLQKAASHLIDSVSAPVTPMVAESWHESSPCKSSDSVEANFSFYCRSDRAELSYDGGLLGSGSGHLRAPPVALWLLHCSLLC